LTNAGIYLVHLSLVGANPQAAQVAMLINDVASTGVLPGDVLIQVAANTTVQFFNNNGPYQLGVAACSIIFTRLQ
jgi:hypothetical protein